MEATLKMAANTKCAKQLLQSRSWWLWKGSVSLVLMLCCGMVAWMSSQQGHEDMWTWEETNRSKKTTPLAPMHIVYEEEEEPQRDLEGVADEGCVGLVRTKYCAPWGQVIRILSCRVRIKLAAKKSGGFCQCAQGRTANHFWCRQITSDGNCEAICRETAHQTREKHMYLPEPLHCLHQAANKNSCILEPVHALYAEEKKDQDRVRNLWKELYQAYQKSGAPSAQLRTPGPRNGMDLRHDFVVQGLRMVQSDVEKGRQHWKKFLKFAPHFSAIESDLRGRGIVIVGGVDGQYLLASLVLVTNLRRLGCKLPIEVWMPESEAPSQEHFNAFGIRGAQVRLLFNGTEVPQTGYATKLTAIALSSFTEVMFLDSDSYPAINPDYLFETREYKDCGAIVWPDFWENTAAPDLLEILEIEPERVPQGTHESGQILLDKRKTWTAILLALFMNLEDQMYYPLLTTYMGQGDKESIPYALTAVGLPYHKIQMPIRPVGFTSYECLDPAKPMFCTPENFYMSAMLQHDLEGRALFVHNNHPPKATLYLPNNFRSYIRRWQRVNYQDTAFLDTISWTGVDIERVIYEIQRTMACDPCIMKLFENGIPGKPQFHSKLHIDPQYLHFGQHLPILGGMGAHQPLIGRNISFSESLGMQGE